MTLATHEERGPEPKLFFVGFNKCGTSSIQQFFVKQGYAAVQCRTPSRVRSERRWIARIIDENAREGRPILSGLTSFQVFSDLTYVDASVAIEANKYFREFHREYPDAYFVFNDRPVEKWIRSRLNHENEAWGDFTERYAQALSVDREAVIDVWKRDYAAHKAAVLEYFAGNPRFMVFDIEAGSGETLSAFLKADFRLKSSRWAAKGQTWARLPERLLNPTRRFVRRWARSFQRRFGRGPVD